MATKTIDHLDFMVDVTPYEHEGNKYDALRISVTYVKGSGFYASWMPVKRNLYGYQTGPLPSSDKLVGGVRFLVERAAKNSSKRLTDMNAALELAKEGIALYFDKRGFEQLNNFMRYVALYGFTPYYQQQVEDLKAAMPNDGGENDNNQNNNNQTSEEKTMATKNINESANVQNAQVKNNAAAIEDVNVGEVTVDSIMPVMQPVEEKPAVTVPLGDHGTLVVGGVPKPKKSEDKPKVTLKRKTPQKVEMMMVHLVTYTTKRGEQAPRIEGFGGENDPRWKRHYDDKVRLAQQKKEADAFNEKLQAQMKGKPKAEREKLRKQWKSVGSDPFGASYFTDRTTGDKYYQMTMGAKYMDVARELVDAYNSGDEQAISAAEQAVIDCKNGIVRDIEAQRDAKRAEREAKKAAAPAAKPQVTVTAGYSDQDVADMLRKVMAGGDVPENIKKLLAA